MSFSSDCKKELCQQDPGKECCRLAELCGLYTVMGSLTLLGRGKVSVRFSSESMAVSRRAYTLLVQHFHFAPQIQYTDHPRFGGRRKCVLTLGPVQSPVFLCALRMMEARGEEHSLRSTEPRLSITRLCDMRAYLRGVFLGGGTMTSPDKGYHLELPCRTEGARQAAARCMQRLELPVHYSTRHGHTYMYLKQSDQVSRFLTLMGAQSSIIRMEDCRLRKEVLTQAKRSYNCDSANLNKTLAAGTRELQAIRKLQEEGRLEDLPPALREIAKMRLEAPEATLAQLGEMLSPPVGKSGVNHRMRRLLALAEEGTDNRTE